MRIRTPQRLAHFVTVDAKIDQALSVADMIIARPQSIEPGSAPAWPQRGFAESRSYTDHRRTAWKTESDNAARLVLLVHTLTTLMDTLYSAVDATQAQRMTRAIEVLGGLLTHHWQIEYDDLPARSGDKYVPLDAWATARTRIPESLPLSERDRRYPAPQVAEAKPRGFAPLPNWGSR